MKRALKNITAFVTLFATLLLCSPAKASTSWIETPYDRYNLVQTIAYRCHHDVMGNFACTSVEVASVLLATIYKNGAMWYWRVYLATAFGGEYPEGAELFKETAKREVENLLLGRRYI